MKMLLKSVAPLLAIAMFQAPAKPPMKMGLWETTGTSKRTQPDGTDKTTSSVYRSCVTPANWLKMMGPTARETCPKVNETWSKDDYSFDVQCAGKPKLASARIHFDSQDSQHGSVDFSAMPDGSPLQLHAEFEGHWVAAECGDVSPDHPVLVR